MMRKAIPALIAAYVLMMTGCSMVGSEQSEIVSYKQDQAVSGEIQENTGSADVSEEAAADTYETDNAITEVKIRFDIVDITLHFFFTKFFKQQYLLNHSTVFF